MSPAPVHPAQRFRAPSGMQAGVPLKDILGARAIALIGESLAAVVPGFDRARFAASARRGLAPLGLLQRGARIGEAMGEQLPEDITRAAPLLIASFGPPLAATAGNGLAPFFYLPHASFIMARGASDLAAGLRANYELTRRFTAEFSLRPLIAAHQDECLAEFVRWCADPDPHVRRAVSESTRPRLPWASRLSALQRDPTPVLPLLERLKDDPELYVRRSVANHLGDIAKDHPDIAIAVCRRWLDEVRGSASPAARARRWLIRHAVRHPARTGVAAAERLRREAK